MSDSMKRLNSIEFALRALRKDRNADARSYLKELADIQRKLKTGQTLTAEQMWLVDFLAFLHN
jgi:hypothetical protein